MKQRVNLINQQRNRHRGGEEEKKSRGRVRYDRKLTPLRISAKRPKHANTTHAVVILCKWKKQQNRIQIEKHRKGKGEQHDEFFPNCKTVITRNRSVVWHIRDNIRWPVTFSVLFRGTKNSNNEEVMAKSGQKQGHYSVLWWFLGRGQKTQLMRLKAFSGSLMSCSSWAEKSYWMKLWRREGTTKEETQEWVEHERSWVKQSYITGLKYTGLWLDTRLYNDLIFNAAVYFCVKFTGTKVQPVMIADLPYSTQKTCNLQILIITQWTVSHLLSHLVDWCDLKLNSCINSCS